MAPSLDGTWVFPGFSAMIEGPAVTVTVGDGTGPVSTDLRLAAVSRITAKGALARSGTTYKLTLAESDDALIVEAVPDVPPAAVAAAMVVIRTQVKAAQDGEVTITVVDDTMTVKGSFLSALAEALGGTVPDAGLTGCTDRPCAVEPAP